MRAGTHHGLGPGRRWTRRRVALRVAGRRRRRRPPWPCPSWRWSCVAFTPWAAPLGVTRLLVTFLRTTFGAAAWRRSAGAAVGLGAASVRAASPSAADLVGDVGVAGLGVGLGSASTSASRPAPGISAMGRRALPIAGRPAATPGVGRSAPARRR